MFEFAKAMIFTIPLGIFATLTALLYVINAMKTRRLDFKYNRVFFFYFACATLASVLFLAYYYYPAFFEQVDVVYCGALVFTMILFHQFHCVCIGIEKRFSPLHFIVAAIVVCTLLAAKLFLSGYLPVPFYDVMFYVILIFSVYYAIVGIFEMHRFYVRQSITYGSTAVINHSRVVLLILEKLMFPTVFGLLPLIGGQQPGPAVSILLMVAILAALYNNIPLVYSIIRYVTLNDMNRSLFDAIQLRRPPVVLDDIGKDVNQDTQSELSSKTVSQSLLEPENPFETLPEIPGVPGKRIYRKYTQSHRATGQLIEVDKAEFESYFRKYKPFLNPHLTIADLLEPLQCNRTYLSNFVNRTYGMNFNNYLNSCRLNEIDRLLVAPGNRNKTPASLYTQAGFTSYRNYLSAKKKRRNLEP